MEVTFNVSDVKNKTEGFDTFCVKQPQGPMLWGTFSVICVCVGFPANIWLMLLLIQRRWGGLPSDLFILNLTAMDLLFNSTKIPNVLNFLILHDPIVVRVGYFVEGINLNGRPVLMACACVDCYIAVVFPITYMRLKRTNYKCIVNVISWVFTVTFNSIFAFQTHLLRHSIWSTIRLGPIFTIILCDSFILRALRKQDPSGRSEIHPQKKKALDTITNSLVLTLGSYIPILTISLFSDVMPLSKEAWYCSVNTPALIFSTLGSTVLPLLHLRNLGIFKDLWVSVIGREGCQSVGGLNGN